MDQKRTTQGQALPWNISGRVPTGQRKDNTSSLAQALAKSKEKEKLPSPSPASPKRFPLKSRLFFPLVIQQLSSPKSSLTLPTTITPEAITRTKQQEINSKLHQAILGPRTHRSKGRNSDRSPCRMSPQHKLLSKVDSSSLR